MPPRSKATAARLAAGIERQKDPARVARGKAAAAKRLGKSPQHVAAASANPNVRGGKAAIPEVIDIVARFRSKTNEKQQQTSLLVINKALDESANMLDMLVGIAKDLEAAPKDRIAAGKAVLDIAGIGAASGNKMKPTDDGRTMAEWTLSELQAFVAGAEQEVNRVTIEGEVLDDSPE